MSVRFGSFAPFLPPDDDFRSTPVNGHLQSRRHVSKVPTAEVAVAAYSIKSLAPRRDGASLWKSCFAEAVDIDLR